MREKKYIDTLGNGGIYKYSHEKNFYLKKIKMELKKTLPSVYTKRRVGSLEAMKTFLMQTKHWRKPFLGNPQIMSEIFNSTPHSITMWVPLEIFVHYLGSA
jgi:hypothetical protein